MATTKDAYGNVINTTVDPSTQAGSGTYGGVAGATTLPDVEGDLAALYPNLSQTNAQASQNILSGLQGNLTNSTLNAIQDAGARFGVTSGMPLSQLQQAGTLNTTGKTSEAVQQQALQDYNNLISTISKTQTVTPETQISLDQANKKLAAEANPQDATNYALSLYNQYLSTLGSGGSGTSGATSPTIRTNAGGSGTVQPYEVTTPGAAGGGSGYGVTSTGNAGGGYTPVTGNTYGYGADTSGLYSDEGVQPTTGGTMFTGTQNDYDWEQLLNEFGL